MMLPNDLPMGRSLPKSDRPSLKADLRREISPWAALVWAYADECVGLATNVPDGHHLYVSNGLAQTTYGERMARGSINARLDAHEDAFTIDGFLYQACGGADGLKAYHRIREAAERRVMIPAEIELAPLRCVPRLDHKGRIDLVLPMNDRNRDRAISCLVDYEGYADDVAERMRKAHGLLYEMLCCALACMVDLRLVKWRVLGA